MKTALDTNVLSALLASPPQADAIATMLDRCRSEGGIAICGVVFAELSAHPKITPGFFDNFLSDLAIEVDFDLDAAAWRLIATAFAAYARRRRSSAGGTPKRLLADFIVGAHALCCADRLATLDRRRYQSSFPALRLIEP